MCSLKLLCILILFISFCITHDILNKNRCGDDSYCRDSETCCKMIDDSWGCCPYAQGVCCSDRLSCCPNGYSCDLDKMKCIYDMKSLGFLEIPMISYQTRKITK